MNPIPEVCGENAWASVRTASKAQMLALRHYFARRDLDGSLAALTEAACGHQSQGRPPGSAVYLVLHREARLLVDEYSNRWGSDLERLYAELPGFSTLRHLAEAKPKPGLLATAVLVVIAMLVAAFAVGVAGACMRAGYYLVGGR
jgi:hypothetical protein